MKLSFPCSLRANTTDRRFILILLVVNKPWLCALLSAFAHVVRVLRRSDSNRIKGQRSVGGGEVVD